MFQLLRTRLADAEPLLWVFGPEIAFILGVAVIALLEWVIGG